ncbi:hypothetical protein C8Q70DRAFT_13487 [Cubamyces menziesii]|uniref:Uncharacterized protein n=1 Tax=Trametes cubensis TaxID=1111947 RepID=A0AAD7U1T0_9APHY|nr:hypothetical protein C8Q70DRAFT_13487 [Cubamyces menziesii]KAJ8496190.1 hypothetical protein ONZ51_g1272 [Trametes cubensis]
MPNSRDLEKKVTTVASTSGTREVNSLLHTLRGEHFRHAQNLRRSKAHLVAAAAHTYNDPSLPFSDIYRFTHHRRRDTAQQEEGGRAPRPPLPVIRDGRLEHGYPRGPVPGPPPPESWSGLFGRHPAQSQEGYDPSLDRTSPVFRRKALSLVFSHLPYSFGSRDVPLFKTSPYADHDTSDCPVPPLAQICLRVILAEFPDAAGFSEELLPVLPDYFRHDVLRYSAVHDPLPNAKLYPLCEPEGHVDGELIVVGPQATLQRERLLSLSPDAVSLRANGEEGTVDRGEGSSTGISSNSGSVQDTDEVAEVGEGSWEAESSSEETSPPLSTLIVVNTPVPATTLFVFPLILTRLALLALPAPTPVHRLPRICPLLEVLDLSYNPWLNEPPGGQAGVENSETFLQRIEWKKWARLRVVGLRGCEISSDIATKVNMGRWEEVEVVMEEHPAFRTSMSDVEAMMRSLRLD